jgi:hypothetical protein
VISLGWRSPKGGSRASYGGRQVLPLSGVVRTRNVRPAERGVAALVLRAHEPIQVGGWRVLRAFERPEHDEMYRRRSEWAAGIWASGTWANARPASLQVPLARERRTHDEMYGQRSESFQHFAHMGQCTASELQVPLACERRTHDKMYGQRSEGGRRCLRARGSVHGQAVPARAARVRAGEGAT